MKQPKNKDDRSSNRMSEDDASDDTEREIAERKKKLDALYSIGIASRVGSRPGETLVADIPGGEDDDGFKLSIFRRDLI